MSAMRRRGLQIDDPLGPAQPPAKADSAAAEAPAARRGGQAGGEPTDRAVSADSARKPKRSDRSTTGPAPSGPAPSGRRRERAARSERRTPAGGEVWREWTGLTGVGSFRLPHELLAELGDTARELGLPIGLIVAAAITQLLDQSPEQIAALVDRADDARIHGRRTNRRRLPERASG
jgi:hypothetical protein